MTLLRCGKENVESAYVLLFFPTDCNIKKLIIFVLSYHISTFNFFIFTYFAFACTT